MMRQLILAVGVTSLFFGNSIAHAATLRLLRPARCLEIGDAFQVSLWMLDLGEDEVAGFQAFIEFDPAELQFIEGQYTAAPLGLHILTPIMAIDGELDLAAGVEVFDGQPPAAGDALLATLTFESLIAGPPASIAFRSHSPPTALTDALGEPIASLSEISAEAVGGDLNLDGVIDGIDLGILLANWSIPAAAPGCGGATAGCAPDLNCDAVVNGLDLGILLAHWTL